MKLRGLISGVVICAVAYLWAAEEKKCKFTQDELDKIVSEEILMFEHADDMDLVINRLMTVNGVTRYQLASSFSKIALNNMNATPDSVAGHMCHGAIYGLGEFADEHQLTNLVYIALRATNMNARSALMVYHEREAGKDDFLAVTERFFARANLSVFEKTFAWELMKEDAKNRILDEKTKSRMLKIAFNHIIHIDEHTPYADDLYVLLEPEYVKSQMRLEMITKLLNAKKDANDLDFLKRKYISVIERIKAQGGLK